MNITLRDPLGASIAPITCQTTNATAVAVKADCTATTLKRLGAQNITVSGGGFSASLSLTGVPQLQWSGQHGAANSSGSGNFVLVTLPDGAVSSWGSNAFGLLGQGKDLAALDNSSVPLKVVNSAGTAPLGQIYQVSSGNTNAFALSEEGNVWGWARNNSCNLAQATCGNTVLLPVRVRNAANNGSLSSVVQVEAGDGNQVALLDNGTVMSWGQYSGQGDIVTKNFPGLVKTPDGAAFLSDIAAVSAGNSFSLALAKDGRVFAWGYDLSEGRLGSGAVLSSPSSLPNTVKKSDGTDLTDIVSVSAGYNFSLALASDGSVWAWGSNANGQLGQNNAAFQNSIPFAVQVKAPVGQVGLLANIAMVAAGGNHALALDTTGKVFAWGFATSGQLGDGPNRPTGNETRLPRPVVSTDGATALTGAVSIAANYTSSSALMADGKLLMWGDSFKGGLGRGEAAGTSFVNSPTPSAVVADASRAPLSFTTSSYPNLKRVSR